MLHKRKVAKENIIIIIIIYIYIKKIKKILAISFQKCILEL